MSQGDHRAQSPASAAIRCFVLTISDTRTDETDTGGRLAVDLLTAGGFTVAAKRIVRDEPDEVRRVVAERVASGEVDVVVTTGGTGIATRDTTYEAISALLDKRLDGFGELFRMLSYEEIGPAAMLSRACAGVVGRAIVVALPGSPGAVRLALTKLLVPELPHMVGQVRR
ncbi:MAG: MogA/MoaB family molybdenum cofactor biosynthesis protein [Vicinamibacterales bacterium]